MAGRVLFFSFFLRLLGGEFVVLDVVHMAECGVSNYYLQPVILEG
jgi:hypothetical protein